MLSVLLLLQLTMIESGWHSQAQGGWSEGLWVLSRLWHDLKIPLVEEIHWWAWRTPLTIVWGSESSLLSSCQSWPLAWVSQWALPWWECFHLLVLRSGSPCLHQGKYSLSFESCTTGREISCRPNWSLEFDSIWTCAVKFALNLAIDSKEYVCAVVNFQHNSYTSFLQLYEGWYRLPWVMEKCLLTAQDLCKHKPYLSGCQGCCNLLQGLSNCISCKPWL